MDQKAGQLQSRCYEVRRGFSVPRPGPRNDQLFHHHHPTEGPETAGLVCPRKWTCPSERYLRRRVLVSIPFGLKQICLFHTYSVSIVELCRPVDLRVSIWVMVEFTVKSENVIPNIIIQMKS